MSLVVEESGGALVAPVGPLCHAGELHLHSVEKGATIDHIEGVLEIDLEEAHALAFHLPEGTPEGVCHHLHSAWASHSEIVTPESIRDRLLSANAEALAH